MASAIGKEDRYERNPSGVSFVCNHRFFRTFEGLKNRTQAVKIFDSLQNPRLSAPGIFLWGEVVMQQLRPGSARCMKKSSVLNSPSNAVRTLDMVREAGLEPARP